MLFVIVMQVSSILGYLSKFDYFMQPHECSCILCAHNLIMRILLRLHAGVSPAFFSNFLILSMYDVSWGDGWNDLSMSISLTRYSPDSVQTQDRTTYSQFLNIAAKPPVSHDDTIMGPRGATIFCHNSSEPRGASSFGQI